MLRGDGCRAEADKKVALLKAEAEQLRIAAQAQAEANRLIQESLSPGLIELKKVEAWDGKLPAVIGSDTLLDLDVTKSE